MAARLLFQGAEANASTREGTTPLILAVIQRQTMIVRTLLHHGVFELACAGIVKDRKVTLVDVLAEACSTPFHLLVENRAAQRAYGG